MTIDLETLKDPEQSADLQDNIEVITAGQILQDARIASDISVQQISDNLNLKLSVINNIEESVFDKDISPIFMRGYIRCYARYLKISEEDVLRAYDCQNAACEQQAELQSFSRRTKKEQHDNRLMLVSYGIIGFMLIVFLIWGLRGNEVDVVVPVPAAEVSVTDAVAEEAPLASDVIESDSMDTTTLESTVITPELSITQPEDAVKAPEVETPVVVAEPELPVAAVVEKIIQPETTPVDNTTAEINQALLLMFTGDCWIQIKDSNGKTLSTGVKKAGQSISLQGLAPLSIKLGAPEQVTMSYAGEPVDLSTFRKGRLAKFKLPFEA